MKYVLIGILVIAVIGLIYTMYQYYHIGDELYEESNTIFQKKENIDA